MNIEELNEGCKKYKESEGRESFYNVALEIVDKYPLHASIIILATWNVSRFRFMVSNPQNLEDLKVAIKRSGPLFQSIKNRKFQTTNLDDIKNTITEIYSILSKVKGVEYTGASKVMHLLHRNLFIMWDTNIRKGYGFSTDVEDYFNFLKSMQKEVKNIEWKNKIKTLAKAIDEYNYVKFSLDEDSL